jgi:large subunit ribosomal protein L17
VNHCNKKKKLGRKASHRKAMLANLASSLILHKSIKTTLPKAKALRPYVEPIITKTKNNVTTEQWTHAHRLVFSELKNKYAVKELFVEVSAKVADRPGGYTRILKLENRKGDNAPMCMIELVDYNESMLDFKSQKSRTRRGRSKKAFSSTTDVATEEIEIEDETNAKKNVDEYKSGLIDIDNYFGDNQPKELRYYEEKLENYYESRNMEALQEIGTNVFDCEIDVSLIAEDEKQLKFGKEYVFNINISVKDAFERDALLNTFSVYLHTNKLDITTHDVFHKFIFRSENKSTCQLKVLANDLGDTEFNLDFFQNSKRFCQEKFNLKIVP